MAIPQNEIVSGELVRISDAKAMRESISDNDLYVQDSVWRLHETNDERPYSEPCDENGDSIPGRESVRLILDIEHIIPWSPMSGALGATIGTGTTAKPRLEIDKTYRIAQNGPPGLEVRAEGTGRKNIQITDGAGVFELEPETVDVLVKVLKDIISSRKF